MMMLPMCYVGLYVVVQVHFADQLRWMMMMMMRGIHRPETRGCVAGKVQPWRAVATVHVIAPATHDAVDPGRQRSGVRQAVSNEQIMVRSGA